MTETKTKDVPAPVKTPYRETTKRKNPAKSDPGIHPKPKALINKDLDVSGFPYGVHPDKKLLVENGNDEINQILPSNLNGHPNFLREITLKSYKDMLERIEESTEVIISGEKKRTPIEQINIPKFTKQTALDLLQVISIESKHQKEIEELALNLVLNLPEFEIAKDLYKKGYIKFNIQLGFGEIQYDPKEYKKEEEEQQTDNSDEQFNNMIESEIRLQRRLSNMLMQGNAMLKIYLFNLASEELNKIDERLFKLYKKSTVGAQLGYWYMPDLKEDFLMKMKGIQAGSEENIPDGDNYLIKVRGLTFPYLIHEIVKGLYEYLSLTSNIKEAIKDDTLEQETIDLIVGPELFKIFMGLVKNENHNLLPLIFKKFLQLSLVDVREVFLESDKGREVVNRLIQESKEEWEEYINEE